jgi:hypothetical protein
MKLQKELFIALSLALVLLIPTTVWAQPPEVPPGQGGAIQGLQGQIDQEVADRIADVDAEEAARIAADDAEVAARQTADTAERNARISDVDTEEAARIAADNNLQSQIDGLGDGTTTNDNTLYVGSDEDNDEADSTVEFGTDNTTRMTLYENGDLDIEGNVTFGSDASPAVSGEEPFRIIRGYVAADGSIIAGQGFTVTKHPTIDGRYTINFNTSFPTGSLSTQPTPVATCVGFGEFSANILDIGWGLFTVQVQHLGGGGILMDNDFFFIVVGPR